MLSLCENILMQMDANDVLLYMLISHATTFWLLFYRERKNLCVFVDAHTRSFMFGCMSAVHVCRVSVKIATSTRLQIQSILSPMNLTVLACFSA